MTGRQQIVVLLMSLLLFVGFLISQLSQPVQNDSALSPVPVGRFLAIDQKNDNALEPLSASAMKILGVPVAINTATIDQLNGLPGIGPQTAQAILAHREQKGKFQNLDELLQVPGIGPKKLAALRPHILIR